MSSGTNKNVGYSEIHEPAILLLPAMGDPVKVILRTQSGGTFPAIQCIPCSFDQTIKDSYSVKANNKLPEYNAGMDPA